MRSLYSDQGARPEDRAADLLAAMTLDEKLAQLGAVWGRVLTDGAVVREDIASRTIVHGIGHVTRNSMLHEPETLARNNNAIQRWLETKTRLGIPAIMHEEGCAGLMMRRATTFPMPIALASTFDPDLCRRIGGVIAEQMRAVGASQVLAPVLDVARDHRWGRLEETFGEDPLLVARMGVAYIQGAQGDDLRKGVACTAKHFIGYAAGEGGLNWAPTAIGPRALRDVCLPPFAAAVIEARVASVMNAYQEIDGVPCGASREVLTEMLRGELGFTGTVVSDYDTLSSLYKYHNIAQDEEDAAAQALLAGIDVELPEHDLYRAPLRTALEKGRITMADIDAAVLRVLTQKFSMGLFENRYAPDGPITVFGKEDDRALSREAAAKAVILLKNVGGILPLSKAIRRIAVLGPSAHSQRLMQGDYHYPSFYEFQFGGMPDFEGDTSRTTPVRDMVFALPAAAQDLGSTAGTLEAPDWKDHLPRSVTLLQGLQACAPTIEFEYAHGCSIVGGEDADIESAVAAAKRADVAIVALGGRSGLARDCTDGEFNDRADLRLTGRQQELLAAVVATETPTVLVLLNGRPLDLSWPAEHVPAIVEAWLPAEQGGAAVADILFGNVNPAGRLPVTLARSVGQMPAYYNRKPSAGRSQVFGDYADLPASRLFCFGHGLSYTEFAYDDAVLEQPTADVSDSVEVSVRVRNIGGRDGDEVVQLYATDRVGSVTRPVLQLVAFARVRIASGSARRLRFKLDPRCFAFHGRDGAFGVEPGVSQIHIGASSEDIRATLEMTHTGERLTFQTYAPPRFTVDIHEC